MDSILIIVPTEREAAYFVAGDIAAHICGVGMAECAATTARLLSENLLAGQSTNLAILAGIAGTYTDRLAIGDAVVVASETIADLGRYNPEGGFTPLFQKTYPATSIPVGLPAVHSNTVNIAGGIVAGSSGAEIENMEGAAFFAVCERFGVPAMEIRTISNIVGDYITAEGLTIATRNLAPIIKKIIQSRQETL